MFGLIVALVSILTSSIFSIAGSASIKLSKIDIPIVVVVK